MLINELKEQNAACVHRLIQTPPARWGALWGSCFRDGAYVEYIIDHGDIVCGTAQGAVDQWLADHAGALEEVCLENPIEFYGDDPNKVLVKTSLTAPGRKAWTYLEFLLEEGKVVRLRITANPCEALHDPM